MPCHRVAGFGFELSGIKADIVIDTFAKAETRGGLGDLSGSMPGGAGRQFGLFQQHNIRPAFMGQVIGNAASHHTTADDNYPCMRLHH